MDENLREVLMPVTILGTLGISIVLFTRIITDYILKKRMIDKGFVNEDTQAIFKRPEHSERVAKYASLKWGLIVFFAGMALIIMEYLDYQPDSPLPYGIFLMFLALGFLIYYTIMQKVLNK